MTFRISGLPDDTLPLGILVLGAQGRVLPGAANATMIRWLSGGEGGESPEGKSLAQCLVDSNLSAAKIDSWIELVFSRTVPFEDCLELAPRYFQRKDRRYSLEFKPVYSASDPCCLERVVAYATDRTEEMRLQEQLKAENQHVKLILSALRDRTAFSGFIEECRACIGRYKELAKSETMPGQQAIERRRALMREIHTLKGLASSYDLTPLVELAHEIETRLAASETLDPRRKLLLDGERLEVELDLLIAKEDLLICALTEGDRRVRTIKVNDLLAFADRLSKGRGEQDPIVADFIQTFALEDMGVLFKRYESLVANLSRKQAKQVKLEIATGQAQAYCEPYLPLVSACVHVFRNAVDHGMENAGDRRAAGKPAQGTIRVSFRPSRKRPGRIQMIFEDDGRGVNFDAVRKKAVKCGIYTEKEAAGLPEEKLIEVLFQSGFSTRDNVTEVSGRGVGLDAVKYEVDQLGGKIEFKSEAGKGTCLVIDIPYFRQPELVLRYRRSVHLREGAAAGDRILKKAG